MELAVDGLPPGLDRGERAPDMVLPMDGVQTRWYAHAGGRPAVLLHAGDAPAGSVAAAVSAIRARAGEDVTVHVVGPPALAEAQVGCQVLVDREGAAARAYRTDGAAVCFVLDRNLRVRTRVALAEGQEEGVAAEVVKATDALRAADPSPEVITRTTPVLIVPDVLTDAHCARLREVWAADNHATGVEQSTDGRREQTLSAALKRRRDHVVSDAALGQELAETIGRRVMPELRRAFAYRATSFEGFKIGRYDEQDAGFFSAHRDNLSPSTAHRAFALTLNLNDGYEGGELRFPEYGLDLFRPPQGAALLFSGSLLHEVMPVTRGERYVLLSFLFAQPAGGGKGSPPTR